MPDAQSSLFGGSYERADDRSAVIRFRRALVLTLMTLVVPGSAQLVAGHKKVGRIAVRVWLGLIGVAVVLVLLALTSRTGLFSLLTSSSVLSVVRWGLMIGAVAWVWLLLDAWRLGAPRELRRNHRLVMTGMSTTLCFVTAGALLFGAHLVRVQEDFIGSVFASQEVSKVEGGRYNVLLLGGDSGEGRVGLRPDSLTVASIDADTGRTVLIGLPRNLEDIHFPDGTPMQKKFPDGFDCDGCYLNGVNTWANDHAAELGEGKEPGIPATMDAVSWITGLKINYYAMVNLKGFSSLVDAVGGVRINVKERTAIGGVGTPITGYISAGERKLNGHQALWYARSRVQNDDWSRMGRQKCVMNAMLQQLSPKTVLLNAQKIADSSKSLLETNVPQKELDVFMDLALKARSQPMSSVSLTPPKIYTGNPDWKKVRSLIDAAVDKAEGREKPTSGITVAKLSKLRKSTTIDADTEANDTRKDNQSSNLSASC